MQNYFLYARKSTDVEDKQVMSIEAQLSELRALAKHQNLNIVSEFVEKQSAKSLGRPVFSDMMKRVEKGEAKCIICWKLDRLARNPVDGGQISWFLQRGIIQHIQTNERSYYPTDNVLLMSVEFGMANQFILDLSSNTKRGMREKVRRGEYPTRAPVGYLNDSRNKSIVVNHKKAEVIKEAFELYAQNNSRLEDISNFLAERNVVSSGNKPIHRDQIAALLSNPFYYGHFRFVGEVYEGRHEPIISKQLFDKVQEVLKARGRVHKSPHNDPRPLCGLFYCGNCGCAITAENKTKYQKNGVIHRYVYYRCTRKKGFCRELAVRDEVLATQLSDVLKDFVMPKDWAETLDKMADKRSRESVNSTAGFIQELRSKITDIDRKLQRLKDIYLDQDIEQEEYRLDKNKLVSEKKSLEEQTARFEQNRNAWLAPLKNWLKEAQTLGEITLSPDLHPKKSFAQKIFGSHLFLKSQKIVFTPKTQWAALKAARAKVGKVPFGCIMEPLGPGQILNTACNHRPLPRMSSKANFFLSFKTQALSQN